MTSATVVTLTYPVDLAEDAHLGLAHQLELDGIDGSLAAIPGTGTTLTIWFDEGHDFDKALRLASDVADRIGVGFPIAAEILDEDEYLRRADAPTLPRMMSAPEVADLLDVSRQRVHQLRALAAFPDPLVELRTGPIWAATAIEKFAATWERKPGRPARTR